MSVLHLANSPGLTAYNFRREQHEPASFSLSSQRAAADKIKNLITSGEYRVRVDLLRTRPFFVLCGYSGSGKSWGIEIANQSLPTDEQVAECQDLLWCTDPDEAIKILVDDGFECAQCKYIAYSTTRRDLGEELQKRCVPSVFLE